MHLQNKESDFIDLSSLNQLQIALTKMRKIRAVHVVSVTMETNYNNTGYQTTC